MRDLQREIFGVFDPCCVGEAASEAFETLERAARRQFGDVETHSVESSGGRLLACFGVVRRSGGLGDSPHSRLPCIGFASRGRKGAIAGRALLFAQVEAAERIPRIAKAGDDAPRRPDSDDDLLRIARFWSERGFDRERRGPSPVEGEFAVAILDVDEPSLTLVRDPAGVEAMYWFELGGGAVAFSSTPHALLALPQAPADPDMEALRLNAFVSCEMPWRSYWRGVSLVAPGGLVRAAAHGVERRRWWHPDRDETLVGLDRRSFLSAFVERLATCVGERWTAEPSARAILYSGGLDSSMILASVANAAPNDDVAIVSVVSGLESGAEDVRLQSEALRRFPYIRKMEISASGLDPLSGAESIWERSAAPNVDPFACANLALAEVLDETGLSGGHGGFGGDFAISSPSGAVFSEALGAFRLLEAKRIYSAFSRSGASRRKLLLQRLPAAWTATRPLARAEKLHEWPAAPFLPPDSDQVRRWAEEGMNWPEPPAATLRETQRGALSLTSAQWPMRMLLAPPGRHGQRMISVSAAMLDTRLTSAAMAAPIELAVFRGRTRGLARAVLTHLGFEQAAERNQKSDLAPEIWRAAARSLASRRKEMRSFQDFRLWREQIDQHAVDALMAEADQLSDRRKIYALLRAWFFGEFLRLASERR